MKIKQNTTLFIFEFKAEIIINRSDIENVFQQIYTNIFQTKPLRKSSGYIIDSAIFHTISISKYNPLARSSYIKLRKELDHPLKD